MATEILYCARCRRVILPKEVAEGRYHFVDGDPVCGECFTRLSRRLRAQPPAEPEEQPEPVDISDIPAVPVPLSVPAIPAAERPPSRRREPRPRSAARIVVPLVLFVVGLALGAYGYFLTRPKSGAGASAPVPTAVEKEKSRQP